MRKIFLMYKKIYNTLHPNVKIIYSVSNQMTDLKRRVAIFSHYDKDGLLDDYVLYYLDRLKFFADIVLVSTSPLDSSMLEKINFCKQIIITENRGYDFGAWKTGMDAISLETTLYEELILCNDSVYGPLFDLNSVFTARERDNSDIFSITDSHEIVYHLQSFFVIYQKKVWQHPFFKTFWSRYYFYEQKYKLILNSEIGFMSKLLSFGFSHSSYCNIKVDNTFNPMQLAWKYLIEHQYCPFIKRELLIKNVMNVDISCWKKVVANTEYPIHLILNHIKRLKDEQ